MKNFKIFCFAFVALLATNFAFAGGNGPEKKEIPTATYAELQECYGDNIVLQGTFEMAELENAQILMMGNACQDFPDLGNCGPVGAQAAAQARDLAQQCCCDVFYEYECCDPRYGPILYLAIAQPRGNCN